MDKLQELIDRRNAIISGGNEQNDNGKLSARERINLLFDSGSFVETDIFSGRKSDAPAQGVITGYGTVDSRLVFVYAQDKNACGGVFGKEQADKICKIMDTAIKTGAPCISLLDSCGTKLDDGLSALAAMGSIYKRNVKASGAILQIAAIFGTCAGGAVYSPAMADFVVMTKKSYMMLNGAGLCSKEGKIVTEDEIGSAEVNANVSGNAHFVADDDASAIAYIKKLITLLPSNSEDLSPEDTCNDDLNRLSEALNAADIKAYDVINQIFDAGEFTEVSKDFAKNIIIGFSKMNGRTVAVVANNGELNMDAADKAARFIRFADSFNLPVVTLCDVEGFEADAEQECGGLIRHASKLVYAYAEASVPKVTVICKKACGSASVAMGSRAVGADMVLAWPNAIIGALSPEMASVLLYNDTIKNSKNPAEERGKVQEYYADQVANAFNAAEVGFVDDVIEPDSTRPRIAAALEMLYDKREDLPLKKHGNIAL